MTAASVFPAIGAGLLTTYQVDTSVGRRIRYQVIYGVGMDLEAQTPLMVAQNVVALEDIAIVSSFIMMMQAIGGYVLPLLRTSCYSTHIGDSHGNALGIITSLFWVFSATGFLVL